MTNNDWKNKDTTVAIADEDGNWQYMIFDTWEEARDAVNAARREGKAAVIYDGATLPYPPDFSGNSEIPRD